MSSESRDTSTQSPEADSASESPVPHDSVARSIELAAVGLSVPMLLALTVSVVTRRGEPTAVCGFVGLLCAALYVVQRDRPRSW